MGLYFYLFYYIIYCYMFINYGVLCVPPTIPYLGLSQINQLPNGSINFSNKCTCVSKEELMTFTALYGVL